MNLATIRCRTTVVICVISGLLLLYIPDCINAETAILDGDGTKHFHPVIPTVKQGPDIDAGQIIYPILRPMMRVFDMMQQNAKALEYADKVEKERQEDILRSPKSFFDLFKPTTSTTTTTPKPMIERLLEPFLQPLTKELSKLNKAKSSSTDNGNDRDRELERRNDDVAPILPETAYSRDSVRRSQPKYNTANADQQSFGDVSNHTIAASNTNVNINANEQNIGRHNAEIRAVRDIRRTTNHVIHPDNKGLHIAGNGKAPFPSRFTSNRLSTSANLFSATEPFIAAKYHTFNQLFAFNAPVNSAANNLLSLNKKQRSISTNPKVNVNNFNINSKTNKLKDKTTQTTTALTNNLKHLTNEFNFLNPLEEIKPVHLDNPFTPNPVMGLFTATASTVAPFLPSPPAKPIHDRTKFKLPEPPPLPDPFYNPLFPQKKSKLMKMLFGDTPGLLFGNKPKLPFAKLLESLGLNALRRDEVQVGRDRTLNVLGMPIGRRDGLMLSPMQGLSYGNQDMYGPIAVNDKYNVNWGFLNKIGNLVNDASQKFMHMYKAER